MKVKNVLLVLFCCIPISLNSIGYYHDFGFSMMTNNNSDTSLAIGYGFNIYFSSLFCLAIRSELDLMAIYYGYEVLNDITSDRKIGAHAVVQVSSYQKIAKDFSISEKVFSGVPGVLYREAGSSSFLKADTLMAGGELAFVIDTFNGFLGEIYTRYTYFFNSEYNSFSGFTFGFRGSIIDLHL